MNVKISDSTQFSYRQTSEGLGIDIPAGKSNIKIAFLSVWLAGWSIGGVFVIIDLFSANGAWPGKLFSLFWLAGWAVGMGLVSFSIVWQFIGREVVFVTSGSLVIESRLIYRFRRRIFPVDQVSDLKRIERTVLQSRKAGSDSPTISFDANGKTTKFGRGLDEDNAQEVVNILKKSIQSVFKREQSE